MSRKMLCDWTGKVIHFARTTAITVAKQMGHREVYRCPNCGFWHTASFRNKGRKAKERMRG